MIEETLKKLNEAENNRSNTTVDETINAFQAVMAHDVKGWDSRGHIIDRETELQIERNLFTMLPDYHRTIERMIIDPPFIAFAGRWQEHQTWYK